MILRYINAPFFDLLSPNTTATLYEINAIPIIAYHNIQDANLRGSTGVALFSEEMKYLHDNNFRVIRVSDLGFNQTTNNLYVKGL